MYSSSLSVQETVLTTTTAFRSLSTAALQQLPPNLKIDPRSSFAPRPVFHKKDDDDDDQDKNNDDNDDSAVDYDEQEDDFALLPLPIDPTAPVYAVPLPARLHANIYTLFAADHSNMVGTIHLHEAVFGHEPIRVDFLKRAVEYYRAKKRGRRPAVTKTISEVSGSGRKVRAQKGGGIARAGHSRPAHWRGGAKAHGPKNVTDYSTVKLNKKVRQKALQHALSQKLLEGNLILLNELHSLDTHKTKDLAALLDPWDIGGRHGTTALILDHYYPQEDSDTEKPQATSYSGMPVNLWVASGNLFKIKVGNSHVASVYDILKYDKLVLTLSALEQIEERLKNV
jgi:large subunit ribosomal protein L4